MKDNYFQVTGRPHSGLQNPEKYGLTFEQVVDLIERGKWVQFYKSFRRSQKRKEQKKERIGTKGAVRKRRIRTRKKKFTCKCCKKTFSIKVKHLTINPYVHLCLGCIKLLVEKR